MGSPRVFYITGTPGVGKTRVGAVLAKQIGAKFIDLNDVIKGKKMYTEYDRFSRSFVVDTRKVRSFLRRTVLDSSGSIVVSSHLVFPLPSVSTSSAVVVLRLSPLELMKRLKDRGYTRRKIAENVSAELLDLSFHEAQTLHRNKVLEIDATRLSAKQVADLIRRLVKRGARSENKPKVDWIRILEKQNNLSIVTDFLSSALST